MASLLLHLCHLLLVCCRNSTPKALLMYIIELMKWSFDNSLLICPIRVMLAVQLLTFTSEFWITWYTLDLFDGILRACEHLQIVFAQSAALSYGTWFVIYYGFILCSLTLTGSAFLHSSVKPTRKAFWSQDLQVSSTTHWWVPNKTRAFAALDKLEHFQLLKVSCHDLVAKQNSYC